MSLIGTVLVEHSMLLLLKNRRTSVTTAACYCFDAQPKAAIEAVILIGVAMVAGSGSSTGLKSEQCLAPPSSSTSALLSFKKLTIDGQKTQSLPLLQPYYRFYAQLKVAKAMRA